MKVINLSSLDGSIGFRWMAWRTYCGAEEGVSIRVIRLAAQRM